MRKGDSIIRDPEQRRLRALAMLEYRIKNSATYAEVAKEFNVSEKTVTRTLTWAKRAGLMVQAEDRILSELVPKAIKAISDALDEGNADVALEIFKGTIPGFSKHKAASNPQTVSESNELAAYVASLRGELAGAIEGEVFGPEKALPAATEGADSEGIHVPHRTNPNRDGTPEGGS